MSGFPFACIVPGCPVLTSFVVRGEGSWAATLGFAPTSVVAFLTGTQPLPVGSALGVFLWRTGDADVEYVGALTAERPSSIFTVPARLLALDAAVSVDIGFRLMPLPEVQNLGASPQQSEQQYRAAMGVGIAQRVASDFYTTVVSRAMMPDALAAVDFKKEEAIVLPAKWADEWYARMNRKVLTDAFWK